MIVIIILIPLLMSNSGKTVDKWTQMKAMPKKLEALEALEALDHLEGLEDLSEFQVELDSILSDFDIPDLDSFIFIIPTPPEVKLGKNGKMVSISKQKGFMYYDVPPKIIGGANSIYEHLVYPKNLKKAGIEGMVTVQVYVEKDGQVSNAKLIDGSIHDSFGQAALDAVMKIKFEPIVQDDDTLSVWVALPVFFKLDE
jgi:TonB family protein